MNRGVNILQYVKGPSGDRQWKPIPKNLCTSQYIWSKTQSDHIYIVWRENGRRRYQKEGTTAAEALEAQQRKEFELAGRALHLFDAKTHSARFSGDRFSLGRMIVCAIRV